LSAEETTTVLLEGLDGTENEDENGDGDEDDFYAYDGVENDMAIQNNQHLPSVDNESSAKIQSEMQSIRNENHDIILNLSKNTLRNILLLLCDEGVGFCFVCRWSILDIG
jgi:hypothetical protein